MDCSSLGWWMAESHVGLSLHGASGHVRNLKAEFGGLVHSQLLHALAILYLTCTDNCRPQIWGRKYRKAKIQSLYIHFILERLEYRNFPAGMWLCHS